MVTHGSGMEWDFIAFDQSLFAKNVNLVSSLYTHLAIYGFLESYKFVFRSLMCNSIVRVIWSLTVYYSFIFLMHKNAKNGALIWISISMCVRI